MTLNIHNNDNYPYRICPSDTVLFLEQWVKEHTLPLQIHVTVVSPDFWLNQVQLDAIGRIVSWETEGMNKIPMKDKEPFDKRVQLVTINGRTLSSEYQLPTKFKISVGGRSECFIPPLTYFPIHRQIEIPLRYLPRPGFEVALRLLRELDPKIQREEVAKLGTSSWYNPLLVEACLVPQPELHPEAFGNDLTVIDGEKEYYQLSIACLDSDLSLNLAVIISTLKELKSSLLPL